MKLDSCEQFEQADRMERVNLLAGERNGGKRCTFRGCFVVLRTSWPVVERGRDSLREARLKNGSIWVREMSETSDAKVRKLYSQYQIDY